jgi:hypothetical protein
MIKLYDDDRRIQSKLMETEEDIERINNLIKLVNAMMAAGRKAEAKKQIRTSRDNFAQLLKHDPERIEWLLKQVDEKFGDLSKPARVIPLREMYERDGTEGD